MDAFDIHEDEFTSFVAAEQHYLDSLSSEPAGDINVIDYLTALENITDLQYVWVSTGTK
jgi:hypothetical protein